MPLVRQVLRQPFLFMVLRSCYMWLHIQLQAANSAKHTRVRVLVVLGVAEQVA